MITFRLRLKIGSRTHTQAVGKRQKKEQYHVICLLSFSKKLEDGVAVVWDEDDSG